MFGNGREQTVEDIDDAHLVQQDLDNALIGAMFESDQDYDMSDFDNRIQDLESQVQNLESQEAS